MLSSLPRKIRKRVVKVDINSDKTIENMYKHKIPVIRYLDRDYILATMPVEAIEKLLLEVSKDL